MTKRFLLTSLSALMGLTVLAATTGKPVLWINATKSSSIEGGKTTKTDAVSCLINIRNLGDQPANGLKVKYAVLSESLAKGHAKAIAAEGEETVDLATKASTVVKTTPCQLSATRGVELVKGSCPMGGCDSSKSVRSGEQYYGIVVAVYQDDVKVASYADPRGVEAELKKLNASW